MKQQALKVREDCLLWSSATGRKVFSKIDYSFKTSLQKWILSRMHVIQSPIENDYITFKFDCGIIGVNTELHQTVILQLYVRELHI